MRRMIHTTFKSRLILGVMLLLAQHGLDAAELRWQVDPTRSRLGFTAFQAGAEFAGVFKKYRMELVFDPSDLGNSRFFVEVDLSSVDTQADDRDEVLRSSDMFDVARWPLARFETLGFTHRGDSSYEAEGILTIRDVSRTIRVPFTFVFSEDRNHKTAYLRGNAHIRRLDFGVGQGDLEDTAWVGNDVQVKFLLYLVRQ